MIHPLLQAPERPIMCQFLEMTKAMVPVQRLLLRPLRRLFLLQTLVIPYLQKVAYTARRLPLASQEPLERQLP